MKVRAAIARMGYYRPPLEGRAEGGLLLLDFNESTQPPPRAVVEAMVAYLQAGRVQVYPAYAGLTRRLAEYVGVGAEQILLTNGSDQALEVILRALLEPGDEMIFPRPGFAMVPQIAQTLGAVTVAPAYRADMGFPFEEIRAAVTPKTRLIALIDPNNPTGTAIPAGQLEALLAEFPQLPLLVDEAYFEFTGQTAVPLIAGHDNLVVTRTFSKAFAVAGLRLGYAVSNPAFVAELHKIRGPYDVNALAVAGAEALLENRAETEAYLREVMEQAKPLVERFFREHEVPFFAGAANFMLVKPGHPGEAYEFLRAHKILVRPQKEPIADTFRLSVGTVAEMQRFMEVFGAYLATAPARPGP